MKSVIIYMLEVLACSGVLLAAYTILLERRVKFCWCRRYLLLSVSLAALIPLLRIPIWPGRVIMATPIVTAPELTDWTAEVLPDTAEKVSLLTPEAFGAGFYLIGLLLVVGVILWQVLDIRRLRRSAELSRIGDYRLVRTQQQIASFSFWRTIYVWAQTPGKELAAIVAHESSHIAHRHSLERILMEVLKALLWWNPFAWIAARRLTEAQEFEADHDVLNSGYDRADYMQTIFKQLFGYSPDIANGLRNSLTKKRFKMMTDKTNHRHGLLRLAATLPAVIGLLCAFGFTSRAAIVVTPGTETVQANADKNPSKISLTIRDENKKPIEGAIIQIVGTTQGTVTDKKGHAKISASKGDKLTISYPNFATKTIDIEAGDEIVMVIPLLPEKASANKVESISVLKNASALAPYGEKGRNGVIVVTLKDKAKPKPQAAKDSDEPFLVAETMPQFPTASDSIGHQYGNLKDFRAWVQQQVRYPEEALKNNIQGRVVLSFVVEKDGSVSNIAALQYPDESLWEEARRVIASSPKWTPGQQHGEVVRVKYTLPVDFRFSTDTPSTAPKAADPDAPMLVAETMPRFEEGDLNTFRAWVQQRVRYPEEALKDNIHGRVVLSFVVEKDGSVSQITEIESPGKPLSDEVRRVITASPKWTPGSQDGKAVRVRYTLPISFAVQSQEGVLQDKKEVKPANNAVDEIIVVGYGALKKE